MVAHMSFFRVKNFEKFQHYKDRSPPWIKLYNELLDDYDFGLLPDASKMHLIAIWLLASRSDNKIPYDPSWVAKRVNATEMVNLRLLAERGFILLDQPLQEAEQVACKMQADRLSREEGQVQDIEQQRKIIRTVAKATRPNLNFEEFWKVYPRRKGANPKTPAEKLFLAAIASGVDAAEIIRGARLCAASEGSKIGTEFIPQAVKWLRDRRWADYLAEAKAAIPINDGMIEVLGEEELIAWDEYARSKGAKGFPRNSRGGWRLPSRWPPGYVPREVESFEPPPAPSLQRMQ